MKKSISDIDYLQINNIPIPTKIGAQFALCNTSKKLLSTIQFDYISAFIEGYAIVGNKDNKTRKFLFGIISDTFDLILECEHTQIHRLECSPLKFIIQKRKGDKLYFYDLKTRNILFDGIQTYFENYEQNLLVINLGSEYSAEGEADGSTEYNYDGEQFGIIDLKGNVIIKCVWDCLDFPVENIVRVNKYCNTYDSVDLLSGMSYLDGFISPYEGEAYYLFLEKGEYSKAYTFCWNFSEGIGRVAIGGCFKLIEKDFELGIAEDFVVIEGATYGYINSINELIYETELGAFGYDFVNGHARIKDSENKWSWINNAGTEITEFKYKYCSDFTKEGIALAQTFNGEYIYINTIGEIISENYESATNFQDGFALVSNNNLSFLTTTFKPINLLDNLSKLLWNKSGLACLKSLNKSYLFDIQNQKIIFEQNDVTIRYFKQNIYVQTKKIDDKYNLEIYSIQNKKRINNQEAIVVDFVNVIEKISSHSLRENFLYVWIDDLMGVCTLDGDNIVPIEYKNVVLRDWLFAVYKDKKDPWYNILGYITKLGIKYF